MKVAEVEVKVEAFLETAMKHDRKIITLLPIEVLRIKDTLKASPMKAKGEPISNTLVKDEWKPKESLITAKEVIATSNQSTVMVNILILPSLLVTFYKNFKFQISQSQSKNKIPTSHSH